MPLVWGMTIFAGLVEIGLSRVWTRLRTFIPPETAGLVVFLIGVIIGLASLRVLLDNAPGGSLAGSDGLVALITIGVMIGLNIWNKGKLRLFCILVGMVVGYALSGFTGHITGEQVTNLFHQPLFALPTVSHVSWTFDWSLVIPVRRHRPRGGHGRDRRCHDVSTPHGRRVGSPGHEIDQRRNLRRWHRRLDRRAFSAPTGSRSRPPMWGFSPQPAWQAARSPTGSL